MCELNNNSFYTFYKIHIGPINKWVLLKYRVVFYPTISQGAWNCRKLVYYTTVARVMFSALSVPIALGQPAREDLGMLQVMG